MGLMTIPQCSDETLAIYNQWEENLQNKWKNFSKEDFFGRKTEKQKKNAGKNTVPVTNKLGGDDGDEIDFVHLPPYRRKTDRQKQYPPRRQEKKTEIKSVYTNGIKGKTGWDSNDEADFVDTPRRNSKGRKKRNSQNMEKKTRT